MGAPDLLGGVHPVLHGHADVVLQGVERKPRQPERLIERCSNAGSNENSELSGCFRRCK